MANDVETQALIDRYIEPRPGYPGRSDARLIESAVPVWTIVGQPRAYGWDVDAVALEYQPPAPSRDVRSGWQRRK